MAKAPPKRGRGRPIAENPKDQRILVRLDPAIRAALRAFAERTGVGQEATAARMILVERLRREGMLK